MHLILHIVYFMAYYICSVLPTTIDAIYMVLQEYFVKIRCNFYPLIQVSEVSITDFLRTLSPVVILFIKLTKSVVDFATRVTYNHKRY